MSEVGERENQFPQVFYSTAQDGCTTVKERRREGGRDRGGGGVRKHLEL